MHYVYLQLLTHGVCFSMVSTLYSMLCYCIDSVYGGCGNVRSEYYNIVFCFKCTFSYVLNIAKHIMFT